MVCAEEFVDKRSPIDKNKSLEERLTEERGYGTVKRTERNREREVLNERNVVEEVGAMEGRLIKKGNHGHGNLDSQMGRSSIIGHYSNHRSLSISLVMRCS